MEADEEKLIRHILDGHTDAFATLVGRYGAALTGFVSSFVDGAADVDEVVQLTFVAAYEHLGSYDASRASFRTWLWRIAHHTAMKLLRRLHAATVSLDAMPEAVLGRMALSATAGEQDRRLDLLERATEQLPKDDQVLLHLYYAEERSLTDIAYILDTNPNALSSRLYRIRKHLAHLIKTLEHETP